MDSRLNELERCKGWIEDALAYGGGTHEYEDIVNSVLEGKMQLWPASQSCLVTEITLYPRKKVCHIFLGGGELQEVLDIYRYVVQWAIDQGCSSLTTTGRKGWARVLKDEGWESHLVLLEKRL